MLQFKKYWKIKILDKKTKKIGGFFLIKTLLKIKDYLKNEEGDRF